MYAIRSEKGMLVGMFDEQTGAFQIKDGKRIWLIPVPPDGLTITTIKGGGFPEQTYISHNQNSV